MSKTDLVNYIAEETGLTKADSARALEAFVSGVTEGLKKEGIGIAVMNRLIKAASHNYIEKLDK